jgi:hypothetical protein
MANDRKKQSDVKTEAEWRSEVKALRKALDTLQHIVKVQSRKLQKYDGSKLSRHDRDFLKGINVQW